MTKMISLDIARCELLAIQVLQGDTASWRALVEHIWPHLLRQIAARPWLRARGTEDDARNIATSVLERLRRDDHHALRQYFDWKQRKQDKTFLDWLFIVSTNVARDAFRVERGRPPNVNPGQVGSTRGPATSSDDGTGPATPSVKRFLNEVSASGVLEEAGFRPPITTHQTARQVLELAARRLDRDQHDALELWLQSYEPGDIAAALGLENAEAATRLVRSAIAILRRAFGVSNN